MKIRDFLLMLIIEIKAICLLITFQIYNGLYNESRCNKTGHSRVLE